MAGAASVLRERLFEQSDPFFGIVCTKCGFIAQTESKGMNVRNVQRHCNLCETGKHCLEVKFPFAFKLLLQELMAMQISPRLKIGTSNNESMLELTHIPV